MKTRILALLLAIACAPCARAATVSFNFAPVGKSLLMFLPADSPIVGKEITSASILLDVKSAPGSDAANFFTDIAFPIVPFDGNDSALVLTGEELGWSGSGNFHFFEETERFNGTFLSTRFGAETPGFDFEGEILEGSRIEFTYVPEPGTLSLVGLGAGLMVVALRGRQKFTA